MSSRPSLPPMQVLTNGDMSQATLTSMVTIANRLARLMYTYSWNGTSPVGNIQVQVSNDYALNSNGSVANAGTWSPLVIGPSGQTTLSVSGNTGTGNVDITATGAYAIRTVYTKTSGTGTLQAFITGKS